MTAYKIEAKKIRIDRDTQSRVQLNEETVKEYADAMRRKEEFPPILVYFDEKTGEYILADGFHRYTAHMEVRPNDLILAEQRLGTLEDARWAGLAANQTHGLQRTPGDKKQAIRLAVLHPNAREMNVRDVAQHVGVSKSYAASIRKEMQNNGEIPWDPPALDKAKAALEDPENEGLSDRKIAEKIGVSKNTVLNARSGQSVHSGQIDHSGQMAQSENETAPDPNQPYIEERHCHDCAYLNHLDFCSLDIEPGELGPWVKVRCRYFEEKPTSGEVSQGDVPPPDYDNVQMIDPPKTRRHRDRGLIQSRRLKGSVQVTLPQENPGVFAVELRNNFDQQYLTTCFITLKKLWEDEKECDRLSGL